jgi:hypothetical protein
VAKQVPTIFGELSVDLDQQLKDRLRKPRKHTATLRRRALKNRAAAMSEINAPSQPSKP